MFTQIVLCASHNKLVAGVWRWQRLQWHGEFSDDTLGRQLFDYFLRAHAGVPISLIVDAVEEDFRLELLPHANGKVRRQLIERKLNQHYRNTRFRTACFIDRDLHKRRDNRYLFAALNSALCFQGWLDVMAEQNALLTGVYLLPMLSAAWVRRYKLNVPHLLLSECLNSGLRQSYLQHGRLLMSRLMLKPAGMGLDDSPDFYAAETEKTRRYLISQHIIADDTAVDVLWPAMGDDSEQICQVLTQAQGYNCHRMDLAALARGMHMAPQLLSMEPALLHMHVLACGAKAGNLAPAAMINSHRLRTLGRRINAVATVSVVAALVLSGWYLRQELDLREQLQQALATTQRQQALYRQARQNLPLAPLPGVELQRAVQLHTVIDHYPKTPRRMMRILGTALTEAPEIRINRLRWVMSSNLTLADKGGNDALSSQRIGEAGTLYELGFMDGEIAGFAGDYDAAKASVGQVLNRLRTQPDVMQAEVLQAPASASAAANLQGSTEDAYSPAPPAALFKLKLVLKPEQA